MSDTGDRPPGKGEAIAGAAFVLVGLALLSSMLAISYGHTPGLQRLLYQYGLAAVPLVAVIGQGAILIGLWLLWRVASRR
ncbi:MAG: hypothetical protein AB1760_02050 [Pseudomonadota bacterium]|jgi:hypothetical protein|nr:hypothetical protein [Caulobacteraceae bacterium]MDX5332209.1 hypothetical protein [Caulobacteraceae bacterium]MDX5392666.1 hypothetical protein [Caulobacteraceae bacterium]MDX5393076.1 hypothetical protein [Caulobacteraceae bacterium]